MKPCAIERQDEGKGEKRRRQGQIQTEHERDDMDSGDNRDRLQVADDDDNDSPALTGGNVTRDSARCTNQLPVTRPTRSQVCFGAGVLCDGEADHARRGTRQEGRYLVGRPSARCWFRWQLSGELEAYSDADWGGGQGYLEVRVCWGHHESGHCLTVWTKKQVVSLFPPRASCTPQSRPRQKGWGSRASQKTREHCADWICNLDASARMCLVNTKCLGKAKHIDMQNLWIQDASKAGAIRHEEGRHEREP